MIKAFVAIVFLALLSVSALAVDLTVGQSGKSAWSAWSACQDQESVLEVLKVIEEKGDVASLDVWRPKVADAKTTCINTPLLTVKVVRLIKQVKNFVAAGGAAKDWVYSVVELLDAKGVTWYAITGDNIIDPSTAGKPV